MKKILIILIAIILCSCSSVREFTTTITYDIHYPDTIITKTYTFDSTDIPAFKINSDGKTNTLYGYEDVYHPKNRKYCIEKTVGKIKVTSFITNCK